MFRYRLHSPDGDDLGEATYAMMIKPGEEIHGSGGERLRVVAVVPLGEEDESRFVGLLPVEAFESATATFAARLAGSRIPCGDELAMLLRERPGLDLARLDLAALGAELGPDGEELLEHLAALVRVYRITPRFEHVEALLGGGLDSAAAISAMPASAFVEQFGETLGIEEAGAIHRRALEANAVGLASLERDARPESDPNS